MREYKVTVSNTEETITLYLKESGKGWYRIYKWGGEYLGTLRGKIDVGNTVKIYYWDPILCSLNPVTARIQEVQDWTNFNFKA